MQRPIRDEFLVFGSPALGEAEIEEVLDSLRSGWLGTGPMWRQLTLARLPSTSV